MPPLFAPHIFSQFVRVLHQKSFQDETERASESTLVSLVKFFFVDAALKFESSSGGTKGKQDGS